VSDRQSPAWATIAAWGLFASATLLLAIQGYFRLFSTFSDYDDEGYILISIRSFLTGGALYDTVYTQYGPAYYLLTGFLFGPAGLPITHEAVRWLALALWLGCSVVTAALVRCLGGGLFLALLAQAVTFVSLMAFVNEPGHP
jgi:hypothetical protein